MINKGRIMQEIISYFRRFVVIYGFTMLATLVFMMAFNRDGAVDWQYFLWCVFFSLAADVPFIALHSDRKQSEKEWRIRLVCRIILSEVILMPIGYGKMWLGWGGGILFFFTILAVGFGIRAVVFGIDAHTANMLNEQIRKRRLERKNGKSDEINNQGQNISKEE